MTQATAQRSAPLKRITSGQVRALHAIGRRRGLDHEALRDVAGVQELVEGVGQAFAGDKRHSIRDLAGGVFSAHAASEVIIQLEHAALKASHGASLEDDSTAL